MKRALLQEEQVSTLRCWGCLDKLDSPQSSSAYAASTPRISCRSIQFATLGFFLWKFLSNLMLQQNQATYVICPTARVGVCLAVSFVVLCLD
jgi:hypothetical protein